jgi:hypothetical protein
MALSLSFVFWLAVGLILIIKGLAHFGVTHQVLSYIEGASWIAAGVVVVLTQGIP